MACWINVWRGFVSNIRLPKDRIKHDGKCTKVKQSSVSLYCNTRYSARPRCSGPPCQLQALVRPHGHRELTGRGPAPGRKSVTDPRKEDRRRMSNGEDVAPEAIIQAEEEQGCARGERRRSSSSRSTVFRNPRSVTHDLQRDVVSVTPIHGSTQHDRAATISPSRCRNSGDDETTVALD